jgi:hypothetical protein
VYFQLSAQAFPYYALVAYRKSLHILPYREASWFQVIVAKSKEERWDGAQWGHIRATREPYMPPSLSSLFICFAFFLLFLLDSDIALEPKTSSLFLTFSYSVTL